jgi:hypothetical protein
MVTLPSRKVFVGCPLAGEDAALVEGWAAAFRALAPGGVVFHLCATLPASDAEAAAACEAAGVTQAVFPRLPRRRKGGALSAAEGRENAAALALQRTRLVREALHANAQVVWFVDAGVRVSPAIWEGVDAQLRGGVPVVVVPTPAGLGGLGPPPRVLAIPEGGLVLCNPRRLSALAPGEGVPILGGGMGCAAVALWAALQVRFVFGRLRVPGEEKALAGEDIGFFYGALKAGLAVRMPPGLGGALLPAEGPEGGPAPG